MLRTEASRKTALKGRCRKRCGIQAARYSRYAVGEVAPTSLGSPSPFREQQTPLHRSEDLMPKNGMRWAREIWTERKACAKTDAGAWMLREAAKVLGLPEEAVDELLHDKSGGI